jgi:hypothetical protein
MVQKRRFPLFTNGGLAPRRKNGQFFVMVDIAGCMLAAGFAGPPALPDNLALGIAFPRLGHRRQWSI